MITSPVLIANRNPRLDTSTPERATAIVEAKYWAEKRAPACESFNDQRADSVGSMGPSSTVAMPIGRKQAYAAKVNALAETKAWDESERGISERGSYAATISEPKS